MIIPSPHVFCFAYNSTHKNGLFCDSGGDFEINLIIDRGLISVTGITVIYFFVDLDDGRLCLKVDRGTEYYHDYGCVLTIPSPLPRKAFFCSLYDIFLNKKSSLFWIYFQSVYNKIISVFVEFDFHTLSLFYHQWTSLPLHCPFMRNLTLASMKHLTLNFLTRRRAFLFDIWFTTT